MQRRGAVAATSQAPVCVDDSDDGVLHHIQDKLSVHLINDERQTSKTK